ncbi:CHAP domain-containing protein [Nonomuraea terrae]|uniref:CHAP domain-containing protein n=1 Tax=Nonomuraea terrae TaxID=2530383 RepID=A0A4R4YCE8_9ACTN|nr:CHAP domain-containing protein [Nonomuraea terrae]TDD41760.1 CHAP domain-containing protein [Nonomuraea terrae]
MAKHRILAASKKNIARAALGTSVLATVLGGTAVANAEATTTPVKTATAAVTANHPDNAQKPAGKKSEETKVSVTAQQVLDLARSQVGTSENSAGGGTPYQKWYAASQRAAETINRDGGNRAAYLNAPWCAMFVSWVGEHSGARPAIGWDAYTVTYAKWFEKNDRWGTKVQPGAVVFFSWSGSKDLDDINHVGFVVKDNGDGTISTVEGNTGNGKVEERVRPKSQVVGYGYPQYAA